MENKGNNMVNGTINISSGTSFVVSHPEGDICPTTPERMTEGFYAHDTRFLSRFELKINGMRTSLTGSAAVNCSLASFYVAPGENHQEPPQDISIVRDRSISHGMHETISLANHSMEDRRVRLELIFDADFADIFKLNYHHGIRDIDNVIVEQRPGHELCLVYQGEGFQWESWIHFSQPPVIAGKTAFFDILLKPKGTWEIDIDVLPVINSTPPPVCCIPESRKYPFGRCKGEKDPIGTKNSVNEAAGPLDKRPELMTADPAIQQAYQRAIQDLQSLLIQKDNHYILAAGLPRFMAIFGRDPIIGAIQTRILGPDLLVGTLNILAGLQASRIDTFLESEPGKIPHEVREGKLSLSKQLPHSCYYGSIDTTPLFIRLLWEAYQWTGDKALLHRFLPQAELAMSWIDNYGDIDGDGFVEYLCKNSKGLKNQGWKDSADSISFADGALAEGPIALCEVQGYVFDAQRKMADIYRILGHNAGAREMDNRAQRLQKRFNTAFWMKDRNFFALALDGNKEQVDSISSNPGHCLWSGIIDKDKAGRVVERLMAPDMFSGWGIRTLSSEMARYHPVSYHNGSVWPHDNSLIAAGFYQYGFREEARRLVSALFEATTFFPEHRFPELFAGYPRREDFFPVPYPEASCPQAWASGAVIYFLEVLAGINPAGDHLMREARTEKSIISLNGVCYRGKCYNL